MTDDRTADRAALLDQLRRTGGDPDRRVLITGGTVLTRDPVLGTLSAGDVLIEGSTIADVADLAIAATTRNRHPSGRKRPRARQPDR